MQKEIVKVQFQQNNFVKNKEKWTYNLPYLRKILSYHLLSRIKQNSRAIQKIIKEYDQQIKRLLELENKISENVIFAERILSTIDSYIVEKQKSILKRNEPNIFVLNYKESFPGNLKNRIKLAYYENTKTFSYFKSKIKDNLLKYFLFLFAIMAFVIFVKSKYLKLGYDKEVPGFQPIERILIRKLFFVFFAFALVTWTIIIPFTPLFLSKIIYLILLAVLLIIISDSFDKQSKAITLTMISLLAINNLEVFAWYLGNYSRVYLLFETIFAIIVTLPFAIRFIRGEYKSKKVKRALLFYTHLFSILALLFYVISLVSNVIGATNLAVYILNFSVNVGAVSIIIFSFTKIIKSIYLATIEILKLRYTDLIIQNRDDIIRKGQRYIDIFMFAIWFYAILQVSEIFNFLNATFTDIFTYEISIGSVRFTFGAILLFVGILYTSYASNKFIKNVVERQILVKKDLKRGSAAAISLTIRIFVLFFGFSLALSATGMDMTRISIIAGALSVGVGFGLQNIVSNFVSGLILIYEKPLQEGDTIEVGNLMGRVTNIGIRASNVITYDGAEVVVPNTNLVSNDLINWTLSDNKKRVSASIGVKYGSDPNLVLELLKEVCLSHPNVLPNPEPRALFVGFGDSSLDFKVLFWVTFEEGLQTKSDINLAIYNTLNEHNIEIPFPQIDLHVKNILGDNKPKDNKA